MTDRILDGIWEGILRLEMLGARRDDVVISMSSVLLRWLEQECIFNTALFYASPQQTTIAKLHGVRISTDFPYNDHILIFCPEHTPLNEKLLFKVDLTARDHPMKFDIFKN